MENTESGNPFMGLEIGGRIQCLDQEHLILSLGEHGYNGWDSEIAVSQDPESPFGKFLLLDRNTGDEEIFSAGHRNPQGLCITDDGSDENNSDDSCGELTCWF